jgi:hypothetical protein
MPGKEPAPFSRLAEELIGDFRRVPFRDPARMRRRPTQDLSGVVEELRQKYRIGREAPEDVIRARWAEIVGPASAAYSQAARLDQNGRRLVVLAAHSVVRSELFLHRELIVEKLRALPGCSGLKTLLIRAG